MKTEPTDTLWASLKSLRAIITRQGDEITRLASERERLLTVCKLFVEPCTVSEVCQREDLARIAIAECKPVNPNAGTVAAYPAGRWGNGKGQA